MHFIDMALHASLLFERFRAAFHRTRICRSIRVMRLLVALHRILPPESFSARGAQKGSFTRVVTHVFGILPPKIAPIGAVVTLELESDTWRLLLLLPNPFFRSGGPFSRNGIADIL